MPLWASRLRRRGLAGLASLPSPAAAAPPAPPPPPPPHAANAASPPPPPAPEGGRGAGPPPASLLACPPPIRCLMVGRCAASAEGVCSNFPPCSYGGGIRQTGFDRCRLRRERFVFLPSLPVPSLEGRESGGWRRGSRPRPPRPAPSPAYAA